MDTIVSLIQALAWPVVVLILAFSFRSELRGAAGKLRKLKYRDFVAEFEQVVDEPSLRAELAGESPQGPEDQEPAGIAADDAKPKQASADERVRLIELAIDQAERELRPKEVSRYVQLFHRPDLFFEGSAFDDGGIVVIKVLVTGDKESVKSVVLNDALSTLSDLKGEMRKRNFRPHARLLLIVVSRCAGEALARLRESVRDHLRRYKDVDFRVFTESELAYLVNEERVDDVEPEPAS